MNNKTDSNGSSSNPYSLELSLLIAFLTLVLLVMIICVLIPHRMNHLLCLCRERNDNFNYIDIALYKTRHSMYRKEVYSRNMRQSLFPQRAKLSRQTKYQHSMKSSSLESDSKFERRKLVKIAQSQSHDSKNMDDEHKAPVIIRVRSSSDTEHSGNINTRETSTEYDTCFVNRLSQERYSIASATTSFSYKDNYFGGDNYRSRSMNCLSDIDRPHFAKQFSLHYDKSSLINADQYAELHHENYCSQRGMSSSGGTMGTDNDRFLDRNPDSLQQFVMVHQ